MEARTDTSFAPSADSTPSPSLAELQKTEGRRTANRKAIVIGAIAAFVVLMLLIGAVVLLMIDPARTANIRDIVIILFAFGSLILSVAIGILLVVLVYRLQELISFLRGELVPTLNSIQSTVNTVRGTTTFVSDNVAKPTIKVASFMAGVQQMAKTANDKVRSRTGDRANGSK